MKTAAFRKQEAPEIAEQDKKALDLLEQMSDAENELPNFAEDPTTIARVYFAQRQRFVDEYITAKRSIKISRKLGDHHQAEQLWGNAEKLLRGIAAIPKVIAEEESAVVAEIYGKMVAAEQERIEKASAVAEKS